MGIDLIEETEPIQKTHQKAYQNIVEKSLETTSIEEYATFVNQGVELFMNNMLYLIPLVQKVFVNSH